jgi:hypothetical protein
VIYSTGLDEGKATKARVELRRDGSSWVLRKGAFFFYGMEAGRFSFLADELSGGRLRVIGNDEREMDGFDGSMEKLVWMVQKPQCQSGVK